MDLPDSLRVNRCLENSREKFNADVEPEPVTVEQQAAQAIEAMTDGGEDVIPDGSRDGRERRLTANEIACDVVNVKGAGEDFDAFCAVVEDVQKAIIRAWTNEERRQAERTMGLTEVAVERDLEQQAMRARERGVDPNDQTVASRTESGQRS